MARRIGLVIEPLDVLFFRDGRPLEVGTRASGGLPMPQTLAGAVRTMLWGRLDLDFSKMGDAIDRLGSAERAAAELLGPGHAWAAEVRTAGPWLCRNMNGGKGSNRPEPLVPVPADLARLGKKDPTSEVVRLKPRRTALPGWRPPRDGMMPLWHARPEEIDRAAGFLSGTGLESYLRGAVPKPDEVLQADELLEWEDRTHVAIDPERLRAEDHMLFSVRFLRLKQGVALYGEVELPDAAPKDAENYFDRGALRFGGEGRRASLRVVDAHAWPDIAGKGDGDLALLVTPCPFFGDARWLPDCTDLPEMVAAAVPGSLAISGWDLARRRPKPARHAVPAGSVYLFERGCQKQGSFLRLSGDTELDALGYGLALKGVWSYE